MKGWILAALVVTFLSGASTGFLIGRSEPPGERATWKDKYIEALREKSGVTKQEDLDRARAILDAYDARVQALKSQLPEEIREEIRRLGEQATREIQAIIDSYGAGSGPGAEETGRDG